MRDGNKGNWEPWYGCEKCSEGCLYCYLDEYIEDYKMKPIFINEYMLDYPLKRNSKNEYIVQSGQIIKICMLSDFFIKEADDIRPKVWDIIQFRSDVIFYITTKRPERILQTLPKWWGSGAENVILNVSCENQKRADERIPILLETPAKHKGLMIAPMLEEIHIEQYLKEKQIEQILCRGENFVNYKPVRTLDYQWVKALSQQCLKYNVKFDFFQTGSNYINSQGVLQSWLNKTEQGWLAEQANLNISGRPIEYNLYEPQTRNKIQINTDLKQINEICKKCWAKGFCVGSINPNTLECY